MRKGVMRRSPITIRSGIRIIFLSIFALIFSGCVQDHVLIKLNPDGSGTIEETLLSNMPMEEIKKECAGDGDCPTEEDLAKEIIEQVMPQIRENAGEFGQGVKLISVKPAKQNKAAGAVAVFAFDDINKVTINKIPTRRISHHGAQNSDENSIKFSFKKGAISKLNIAMFPEEWLKRKINDDEAKESDDDNDSIEKMDPQMREWLRTGRFTIKLEVKGAIAKTNATYPAGKCITLMDVSFESFIGKDQLYKKFKSKPPRSIKEYKEAIKGAKDLKLEMNTPVFVDFK